MLASKLTAKHEAFLRAADEFLAVIVNGKQLPIMRELERHRFVRCTPSTATRRLPRVVGGHEYRVEVTPSGRAYLVERSREQKSLSGAS